MAVDKYKFYSCTLQSSFENYSPCYHINNQMEKDTVSIRLLFTRHGETE